MTSDLKLIFFLDTSWGAPPLCKVSSSRPQRLIFKKILKFRSFRFFAPKKSNFTKIFIFKNYVLKTFKVLYFWPNPKSLTRREVFFKNSRISPMFEHYEISGRPLNRRLVSTIILLLIYVVWTPISVRLTKDHIFMDNGSALKKIKSQYKNFFNAIQWRK